MVIGDPFLAQLGVRSAPIACRASSIDVFDVDLKSADDVRETECDKSGRSIGVSDTSWLTDKCVAADHDGASIAAVFEADHKNTIGQPRYFRSGAVAF